MQLRVISGEDWAAFRELRLRALTDSPNAFSVTLAEVTSNAEPIWRGRAGGPSPVILAFDGDQAVASPAVALSSTPEKYCTMTAPQPLPEYRVPR